MPARKSTKSAAKSGSGIVKSVPAKSAAKKATPAKKATARKGAGTTKASRPPKNLATRPTAGRSTKMATSGKGATLDKFLESQKATLLEERATYIRQAESLRAEADLLAAEREPGDVQFDEESGEGDTLAVERERDLALSAQAAAAVEDIDRALARIADGTYGICSQCGEPIPKERLKALPHASLCVRCKSGGLGRR